MDYELVRTLLHGELREMVQRVGDVPSNSGQFAADMQVNSLTNRVERSAIRHGHIDESASLDSQHRSYIVHSLWELIIQGVLVPTHAGGSQGWPSVSFTEHGRKVIFEERPSPYDPTSYLAQLVSQGSALDPTARFYVEEALGCFRANRHTASTLMLGVVSERLLDLLSEAFIEALASETERKALVRKTRGRPVMGRYIELRKRLDPKKDQLPTAMRDNLDGYLTSIFHVVRQNRNDTGHPTGRAITRDEAYASLYVFPHYCAQMRQLIDHLAANPNTLA